MIGIIGCEGQSKWSVEAGRKGRVTVVMATAPSGDSSKSVYRWTRKPSVAVELRTREETRNAGGLEESR